MDSEVVRYEQQDKMVFAPLVAKNLVNAIFESQGKHSTTICFD